MYPLHNIRFFYAVDTGDLKWDDSYHSSATWRGQVSLAAAFCEWLVTFFIIFFILSFAYEFRSLRIERPKLFDFASAAASSSSSSAVTAASPPSGGLVFSNSGGDSSGGDLSNSPRAGQLCAGDDEGHAFLRGMT